MQNDTRRIFGFGVGSWRRAGGEALWTFGGQGLSALGGLVGIRLLTELAAPEVFGEASLVTGALVLARNCFVAPLGNAAVLFLPREAAAGRSRSFLDEMHRMVWLATLPCALVLLIAGAIWQTTAPTRRGGWWLGVALLALLLIDSAKVIRVARLNAERMQRSSALWTTADAWGPILGAAMLLSRSATTEAYLLGQAMGYLPPLIICGFVFYPGPSSQRDTSPPEARAQLARRVLAYSLPFVPLSLLSWVSNLSDRFVLGGLLGTSAVGAYAAAYALASRPVMLITASLAVFARPILFGAQASGQHDKARRVFSIWMGIGALLAIAAVAGLWLFKGLIARLLLAEVYRGTAARVFPWVGAGYGFYTLAQILENRLLSLGRSGSLVLPSLAAAVTNVIGNFLLIPRFGVVGAASATTASFAVHLAVISLRLWSANA